MPFRQRVADLPPGPGEIHLRVDDRVAIVQIDHPTARNALSPRMMVQLADIVATLAGSDLAAVVIHGHGAFCAGGDLRAVEEHLLAPGVAAEMQAFMAATCDALHALPPVILAAVEGPALGGGAELLTACDLVFAAPPARIGFIQAAMGVSPGFGGARRLLARVGSARALDLLTRARPLTAEEALRIGLIDEIVPDPATRALERAREIASLPPLAFAAVKPLLRGLSAGDPSVEAATFACLWGAPEHVAALARFRRR